MSRENWDNLLDAVRLAHASVPALEEFCPFPDDLRPQDVAARQFPCADLMARETGLTGKRYATLRECFLKAGPEAHWRETYRGTDIGDDFMDRFGCYNFIGKEGAFMSDKMWVWVVYMPARLYYPWHHHPGEETYLVLGGEAEFMRDGQSNETLREGDISEHLSNQPHAMETHEHPIMAMVMWRNGFDTPPVLTRFSRDCS